MPPTLLLVALAFAGVMATPPPGARVVMPASGTVIEGLPTTAARWEVEGTLVVGARTTRSIDRLLGWGETGERLVTIEIRRDECPPPPPPGTTSPWPTLGYAGIRAAVPERRAVRSCKAPDLALELRFPAGTESDEEALLAEADRWESVVAVLHAAYGATKVDIAAATGARAKLVIEAASDAPEDLLARLAAPISLRSGLVFERATDQMPWLVRDIGGHDVLTLLAPTGAGLALQLLPFGRHVECEQALTLAMKSQPPAPPGAANPRLPPGWQMARPIGVEGAAFCAAGTSGGLVAIGGARLPRDAWMPIASPILGRIGEQLSR